MTHVTSLLLGLGNGGVFAALAIALVLTYRSSGVVNFATGTIALYAAYTYASLREGRLLVLIPGLPRDIGVGGPLGFVPAALLALVLTAALGALLYAVVFRPLRQAPVLARAVASLGVLVVMQGLIENRLGQAPVSVAPIFPARPWQWGSVTLLSDRFYLAIAILGLTFALTALYRWTRFGLLTRAVAETQVGALVSGVSPERIALMNWMASAVVAGAAGILIAPISPLTPSAYTLAVVPALAAAAVGHFELMVPTAVAGIVIGMLQSEASTLAAQHSWLPADRFARADPAHRDHRRPARHRSRDPGARRSAAAAARTGAAAAVAARADHRRYDARRGRAAGDARHVAERRHRHVHRRDPRPVVRRGHRLRGPGVARAAHARGRGRLRAVGDHEQLGRAVPVRAAARRADRDRGRHRRRTAGAAAPRPHAGHRHPRTRVRDRSVLVPQRSVREVGGRIDTEPQVVRLDLGIGTGHAFPRIQFGLLCLFTLVAIALGVARLRTSALGSAMLAVRANERSAAGIGVNVTGVKIASFAISSFIAGIGGCLFAYRQSVITFISFTALGGLALLATVYLAGITSVFGGILGGILASSGIAFLVLDRTVNVGNWFAVLTGVGLIATLIRHPDGLASGGHDLARRFSHFRSCNHDAPRRARSSRSRSPRRRRPPVDGSGARRRAPLGAVRRRGRGFRRVAPRRRGRGRRPHRPERRGQDEPHRRGDRVRAVPRARSC